MRRPALHIIILFLALFAGKHLFAQNTEASKEQIERSIEELTSRVDAELDYSELLDHFTNLAQNPININTASEENLIELMFLNNTQIAALIDFRYKNGDFTSIYELKNIEGFYVDLVLSIKPYIIIASSRKTSGPRLSSLLKYGRHQLIMRYGRVLEEQKGYMPISDSALAANPNSRYLGDPNKLYLRYKYHYSNKMSIGFLGEKDAGEEFFTGSNPYGFDFYSAHFFIKDRGRLKALALGDYHLEFGQGLTLWSGLAFGKSAAAIGIQKRQRGIRANTSANENLFFRGGAATFELLQGLDLTAFYSNKNVDAGLTQKDTLNNEEYVFSSITESGFHRTPNEVAKKGAVNEQIYGGNLSYKIKGFRMGATAYKSLYGIDLVKDMAPYQYYDFQGNNNFNAGIDASYANRYLSVFGEFSMSQNGGKAMLLGSIFNLHPRLTFSLLYRNFARDYQVFYAVPFSEGSRAQNEKGIYIGAAINTGVHSNIKVYYDMYSFDWLRYRINAPSHGDEFSLLYENRPNRQFNFNIRYRNENKMLNESADDVAIRAVTNTRKQSLRFHINYSPYHQIKLKSRVEFSRYQHQPEAQSKGYLIYQDIQYRPDNFPMKFTLRYALFNTDDYDTRIYAYENNVLYRFSVPAYYYQGSRFYILLNYTMNDHFSFWLHFAQTYYSNRYTIGSSLEEIHGNTRSEITAQVRMKF
ncbi:MAG: helix-hairpin-helix domain-containing protein [Bacteroidales bacterium]|nr:helix-hairpin-helix domain-containing protein [Bacteroidales bacterium]